jgi:hypothetical protein
MLRSMNAVTPFQTKEELICRAVARHYRLGRHGIESHGSRQGIVSSYVDSVTDEVVLVTLDGKTIRYGIDSFR